MDHLWTPWRFKYIASTAEASGCVFCQILAEGQAKDVENLVLTHQPETFVLLNRFPYTSGHLLIVVRRHIPTLEDATAQELKEVISLAQLSEKALRDVYSPDGFNMGFNIGKCAGAGVAGHLHMHVLPRWVGDANVVSVVGQTRVIPEELTTTFEKLQPYFAKR